MHVLLRQQGAVAELVYAHDSKSCGATRVGSTPTSATTKILSENLDSFFFGNLPVCLSDLFENVSGHHIQGG